jgi:hypothetical protein
MHDQAPGEMSGSQRRNSAPAQFLRSDSMSMKEEEYAGALRLLRRHLAQDPEAAFMPVKKASAMFGLKWEEITLEETTSSIEIKNAELAKALERGATQFGKQEIFERFKVALCSKHPNRFIKAGSKYFRPIAVTPMTSAEHLLSGMTFSGNDQIRAVAELRSLKKELRTLVDRKRGKMTSLKGLQDHPTEGN